MNVYPINVMKANFVQKIWKKLHYISSLYAFLYPFFNTCSMSDSR